MTASPRGVTLVEMLVVLVLLGVLSSVAAMSPWTSARAVTTPEAPEANRRQAIQERRPVTAVHSDSSGTARVITSYADGRVAGDPGIDPLSGQRRAIR